MLPANRRNWSEVKRNLTMPSSIVHSNNSICNNCLTPFVFAFVHFNWFLNFQDQFTRLQGLKSTGISTLIRNLSPSMLFICNSNLRLLLNFTEIASNSCLEATYKVVMINHRSKMSENIIGSFHLKHTFHAMPP